MLKGQDSLRGRQGEPVGALPGRKNDDSLSGIERIAVQVGLAPRAGLGHGGDAQVPLSGIPCEYLLGRQSEDVTYPQVVEGYRTVGEPRPAELGL
jgi:hypothetical protein